MQNNDNNYKIINVGISFFDLLGVAFIILKLCSVVQWSWLWVLAPIWMPPAAVIAGAGIIAAASIAWEWLTDVVWERITDVIYDLQDKFYDYQCEKKAKKAASLKTEKKIIVNKKPEVTEKPVEIFVEPSVYHKDLLMSNYATLENPMSAEELRKILEKEKESLVGDGDARPKIYNRTIGQGPRGRH